MQVTLQALEGIESITIKTTDGKEVRLAPGQPVMVADHDKQLVAAVQKMPVEEGPRPKPGQPR